MRLKNLELHGFKSFAHKTLLEFESPIVAIVGPNGSGKSNVVESIRFVLGEQSMKSMRGKGGSDLVFKGSKDLSKANRASVSIYFNNKDKVFKLSNDSGENINLNYDVISISREVYADGLNKYILNGSEVRLKDIHNLLASVNIGSSGHHIISQGEADRILSANARERKEMVEDALGLKVYQYKIKESERKLERTEENIKEVSMLRRENAPHLNFLKKQVEKFEKTKEMQAELEGLYLQYLRLESEHISKEKAALRSESEKLKDELAAVSGKISEAETGESAEKNSKLHELSALEQKINSVRIEKTDLERKLGRLEGLLEAKGNRLKISGRCPLCGNVIAEKDPEQVAKKEAEEKELHNLEKEKIEAQARVKDLEASEKEYNLGAEVLRREINAAMEAMRDLEREKFTWKVREQELHSQLELIHLKKSGLETREVAFETEVREGKALIGESILLYQNSPAQNAENPEELKKRIDRIKIRLEDAGLGSSTEILKEYEEVKERDSFLERELADLTQSIEALQKLIADLKAKIDLEFQEGIRKINVEFQEFFTLLFGGGKAGLEIVAETRRKRRTEEIGEEVELLDIRDDEEAETEQGVDINVSLPHKKVKELHALSGGERSLTSIALLFAMSQVNPPPFLVLDETDAALDEANSRKYGDMLEKLSKASELIVVTHNRETMSRAGILYGVTVGRDGASKLLSVKFDEAAAIAK